MKSSKLRFHTNKGLLVDTHAYARGRSAPCRPHIEQEEKVWFTKFDKKMCLGRVCMSLKADLNCMVKFVGQNCWQNFCIETTAMSVLYCFRLYMSKRIKEQALPLYICIFIFYFLVFCCSSLSHRFSSWTCLLYTQLYFEQVLGRRQSAFPLALCVFLETLK